MAVNYTIIKKENAGSLNMVTASFVDTSTYTIAAITTGTTYQASQFGLVSVSALIINAPSGYGISYTLNNDGASFTLLGWTAAAPGASVAITGAANKATNIVLFGK